MGTYIIGSILAVVVALAIRSAVKSHKSGGCSGCSGCGHASSCHTDQK